MSAERKVAVIGLGYVGLTIAMAFSKKMPVLGFDLNPVRLQALQLGFDLNQEVSAEQLSAAKITYSDSPQDLITADFYIVTVPTPLTDNKQPDLSILLSASHTLSKVLKKGDIVVYESTVYPGATEEHCIPVLEQGSHLKCGLDFGVGYSPERVNPGDKNHTFENISKIVSATDQKTLEIVSQLYAQVITGGIHATSSIKVAEAAKIVENTQRDINIALLNEMAYILHACDISMSEVLAATNTKWNALPFRPGLVGGHCIGINSHYLAHKAKTVDHYPTLILASQEANEHMPQFLVNELIKGCHKLHIALKSATIAILGVAYKENYPDFHDSKVFEIIRLLENQGATVVAHDPIVNYQIARKETAVTFVNWHELANLDVVIICVAHRAYQEIDQNSLQKILKSPALVLDVKNILDSNIQFQANVTIWKM